MDEEQFNIEIRKFLKKVGITSQREIERPRDNIRDRSWVWHVGLDAEATTLLNELYEEKELGEERLHRLLALFRLTFRDSAEMRADIAGRAVYLGMAMDADDVVRLKPQNLLVENVPNLMPRWRSAG